MVLLLSISLRNSANNFLICRLIAMGISQQQAAVPGRYIHTVS